MSPWGAVPPSVTVCRFVLPGLSFLGSSSESVTPCTRQSRPVGLQFGLQPSAEAQVPAAGGGRMRSSNSGGGHSYAKEFTACPECHAGTGHPSSAIPALAFAVSWPPRTPLESPGPPWAPFDPPVEVASRSTPSGWRQQAGQLPADRPCWQPGRLCTSEPSTNPLPLC